MLCFHCSVYSTHAILSSIARTAPRTVNMLTQVVCLPSEELNANLPERFSRPSPTSTSNGQSDMAPRPRLTLNRHVREYLRATYEPVNTGSWLARPEIPTPSELLGEKADEGEDNDDGDGEDELEIPVNVVQGPWRSKEDYLSAHYELLREDAVAPLRDAVAEIKELPNMMDNQCICIYENVSLSSVRRVSTLLTSKGSYCWHDVYPARHCG